MEHSLLKVRQRQSHRGARRGSTEAGPDRQVKQPCHHAVLTWAGSEKDAGHAGDNSIASLGHLHFFRRGESALLPASTAVLTICLIWVNHRPLRKCLSLLVKHSFLEYWLLPFFSISLSLLKGEEAELRREMRIWILFTQRIMDLFCSKNALIVDVFTSAPSLKFGDKTKLGVRRDCVCVCVCAYTHVCKELLSLRVQDSPL